MTITELEKEKEKLAADIGLLVYIAAAIYEWADSDPTDERKIRVKTEMFGQKERKREAEE